MHEVMPEHDELCFDEGKYMISCLEGDDQTAERLAAVKGQTSKLYQKLWAQ